MNRAKLLIEARMKDGGKTEFLTCRNKGSYSLHTTVLSLPKKKKGIASYLTQLLKILSESNLFKCIENNSSFLAFSQVHLQMNKLQMSLICFM